MNAICKTEYYYLGVKLTYNLQIFYIFSRAKVAASILMSQLWYDQPADVPIILYIIPDGDPFW